MNVEFLEAAALGPVTHGFFTRRGGASSGIYSGLNCGYGSNDQTEIVAQNRARAAAALDLEPAALRALHQIHSSDVAIAGKEGWEERPRADGAVTKEPGVALTVLTADCAPVLLADPEARVIGAAHAGWRGALDGILEAVVSAMIDLGAVRERIRAAVGPSISHRCYEVGHDLLERFLDADAENGRHFVNGHGDRYLFDLPGFVLKRLRSDGIDTAEWIGHCTYSDGERFFSYRRTTHANEPDYGRLLSVIVI